MGAALIEAYHQAYFKPYICNLSGAGKWASSAVVFEDQNLADGLAD